MSGYWVVEVTVDGKSFFATESWGYGEARFVEQSDAEDYADEVLAWYERRKPEVEVTCSVAFVTDIGAWWNNG